jgi:hypothetical protein
VQACGLAAAGGRRRDHLCGTGRWLRRINELASGWRENCINVGAGILIMPHSGMKLGP